MLLLGSALQSVHTMKVLIMVCIPISFFNYTQLAFFLAFNMYISFNCSYLTPSFFLCSFICNVVLALYGFCDYCTDFGIGEGANRRRKRRGKNGLLDKDGQCVIPFGQFSSLSLSRSLSLSSSLSSTSLLYFPFYFSQGFFGIDNGCK